MKTILALTALAAALSASPALAQSSAPGGFYVGALGGYEGIDVESADGSVTADADAAVYGISAGYDLSLGSAFVGVEGELSTSGNSTEFPDSFAGAREGLDADGQYYIGARAGFALTPGIAAYGKVGYTALDTRAFTSSGSLDELDENASGLRFGCPARSRRGSSIAVRSTTTSAMPTSATRRPTRSWRGSGCGSSGSRRRPLHCQARPIWPWRPDARTGRR